MSTHSFTVEQSNWPLPQVPGSVRAVALSLAQPFVSSKVSAQSGSYYHSCKRSQLCGPDACIRNLRAPATSCGSSCNMADNRSNFSCEPNLGHCIQDIQHYVAWWNLRKAVDKHPEGSRQPLGPVSREMKTTQERNLVSFFPEAKIFLAGCPFTNSLPPCMMNT